MDTGTAGSPRFSARALQPVLPGLFLAVLTLLVGFTLGIVFGLNEELIKDRLAESAAAVSTALYQDDAARIKSVLSSSWTYMQRGHLHAGSLGVVAVALSLVLVLLGTGPRVARALSLGLGAGGLGYSLYWVIAGFTAPGLGGTRAAKESLKWLAMPSSGLVVASTAAVGVLLLMAMFRRNDD